LTRPPSQTRINGYIIYTIYLSNSPRFNGCSVARVSDEVVELQPPKHPTDPTFIMQIRFSAIFVRILGYISVGLLWLCRCG